MGAFGGVDKRLKGFPDPITGSGAAAAAPALPPPEPQRSPTAQRGNFAKNASKMVEGLGMGGTILTAPTRNAPEPIPGNMTGTKSLLGV